jgi:hypothetical protein
VSVKRLDYRITRLALQQSVDDFTLAEMDHDGVQVLVSYMARDAVQCLTNVVYELRMGQRVAVPGTRIERTRAVSVSAPSWITSLPWWVQMYLSFLGLDEEAWRGPTYWHEMPIVFEEAWYIDPEIPYTKDPTYSRVAYDTGDMVYAPKKERT